MTLVLAFLLGVVAGLRTATAPAALAWAAWLGWIDPGGTWAGFLGSGWAVLGLSLLALGEYVADQLPGTPSRKVPQQFGARLVSGAFCGAVLGTLGGGWVAALAAGAVGAVAGTLGGAAARARLAARFGRDRPAALIEDAVAILLALAVVAA
jgi:uncharacterized membrane protein